MSYLKLPFNPNELTNVTQGLVRNIPTEVVNAIGLDGITDKPLMPFAVANTVNRTTLWSTDGRSDPVDSNITAIPDMYPFEPAEKDRPAGTIVAFRHRKGGNQYPEDKLRLLRLAGFWDLRYPTTGFFVGTHNDHPEQFGLYIRAQHVGSVGLSYLDTGRFDDLVALKQNEIAMKFFPIGPAARIGRAAQS